jgi:outer membrane protein assembly factor BamB
LADVPQNPLTHGYTDSVVPLTNQTLWKFNTGGQVGSPTVVDGVLYVGSYDHNLYALTSKPAKFYGPRKPRAIVISKPAVAEGIVCVGSEDYNPMLLMPQRAGSFGGLAQATMSILTQPLLMA